MNEFREFLHRLMMWLLARAFGRHAMLSRWLDYLPPKRVSNALIAVGTTVAAVGCLTLGTWGAAFLIGYAVVAVALKGHPSPFLIAVWEAALWIWFLSIPLDTIVVVVRHDPEQLMRDFVYVFEYTLVLYLLVDSVAPPRKRKKVEFAKAKKPVADWLTT